MKRHTPVLLSKVLEVLNPQPGESFADLTAGYGGHSDALLSAVGPSGFGYLFDKDPQAITALQTKFRTHNNVIIRHTDFSDIHDLPMVDIILADIGVSSPQIDSPKRGFSFSNDGPLDMRMDSTQQLTAQTIVNTYSEQEIADILYHFGEERQSRRIARNIAAQRRIQPITTTSQLVEIITHSTGKSGKIHPATRSFQALRIAVNNELAALRGALAYMPSRLSPGGRIAFISFHSLEDRPIKQAFKALCTPVRDEFGQIVSRAQFRAVTKKPITGIEFDKDNPRARSAKLRAVEKIK